MPVPDLAPHVGSWAVIRRATGECVLEIHRSRLSVAEKVNQDAYKLVPIDEYLASLSQR